MVNCNGCTMCCTWESDDIRPIIPLKELTKYKTDPVDGSQRLRIKEGTRDCIYLGENGCTIHSFAPEICKSFDCRDLSSSMTPDGLRMALIAARGFDLIIEEKQKARKDDSNRASC